MKKLKIGIIGVGRLGYEHACNIANRVPGSELVAIADKNFDRAKQVAEELGVTAVYQDPKALCEDPNVEAVAIVTNTDSLVDMIQLAMDANTASSARSRWLTRLRSARKPRKSSLHIRT